MSTWGKWPIEEHYPPLLFNVEHDPAAKHDMADKHPEVVRELLALMKEHQASVVLVSLSGS